ncbi:Predicted protein [Taphrina deformans PYCC 5710]|uniref:Histidine acid phosphatase n=1 Tax=Taphrina deformans (strain PYCC 5710 / ATCC 11124 / CBS 356.35 / IMI 108563 / JCM 9778 / NBRC 8474) TaxID=1097556 RepID=R4XC86_TAPDE|nr:Predicted protein [Taphrina deformans PYCC 5710]|eukprot:CCG80945.1 Predicted protein [Taphrina deformans PYCC 5710]
MSTVQGTLEGVVLMTRHGDRTKFYQDPNSYTGYETHITPLGEAQTYLTGQYIRSRYIAPGAPAQISGISEDTIDLDQCTVTADAAAESNVIVISAYSMWQGMYPATAQSNVTLANGTTVVSPLSGQQYLPIQTVEFAQSPLLEAFTSCPAYTAYLAGFYNSTAYTSKSNASKPVLGKLPAVVDGRATALKDMYNVYDYINVNNIYNATYATVLANTTTVAQANDLSNWVSYYAFSGPTNTSAGNIAGRGMMGGLITSMQTIANASTGNKIQHYSLSYKPFLSIFNMTGAAQSSPELAAVVSDEMYVNMVFRNNSVAGTEVKPYKLLGRDQVKLNDFVSAFNSSALYTTLDWCRACKQNSSINACDSLLAYAGSTTRSGASASATATGAALGSAGSDSHFSPVGAGFIGAVFGIAAASIGWYLLARNTRKKMASRGKVTISDPVPLDSYTDGRASDSKNPFK